MDDLYKAYQLCTCGNVCLGCTVCDSATYQHQPCVKRQWLHLDSIKTFEEKVDRFIEWMQENDFRLVPWQVEALRAILVRGHERS